MKHDELAERVARAMVAADSGPEGSQLFRIHMKEFGPGYLKSALSALAVVYEAIKEPTVEMRREGSALKVNVFTKAVYDFGRVAANDENPGDVGTIFRAMLAASPLNPEAGE